MMIIMFKFNKLNVYPNELLPIELNLAFPQLYRTPFRTAFKYLDFI